MTITFQARALLFDMDGTIVDSTAIVETLWGELAAKHGLDFARIMPTLHGRRAIDTITEFAPAGADPAAIARELGDAEVAIVDGVVALPGAHAFLAALPPNSHAVVTSAEGALLRARMDAAGLTTPDVAVTADDVTVGKPHPEGYLAAAAALGVEPADAVVFEDAPIGLLAAKAAGMRAVVVGDYAGPEADGLPRITGYEGAEISVTDGVITVSL